LSTSINIIKKHKEFSWNIGIIIPLEFLSNDEFEKYLEIYCYLHSEKLYGKKSFAKDDLHEVWHAEAQCVEKIRNELSRKAIVGLFTLLEIGKLDYYSEALGFLYQKYDREACDDREIQEYCSYILNNTQALRYLERAFKKINEPSLLSLLTRKQR
jgi:hypothetical protein